jgi:biotin carboxylase
MDKILSRKICETSGIKTPSYGILKKGEVEENKKIMFEIGKPFVIKPINEGSSIGVEVILQNMPFDSLNYQWKRGFRISCRLWTLFFS